MHNALNDWTEKDEAKRKHTELIENEFRKQCYHKATFQERCKYDKYVYILLLILTIITAIWIS